jgi:hypothetical protein
MPGRPGFRDVAAIESSAEAYVGRALKSRVAREHLPVDTPVGVDRGWLARDLLGGRGG